MEKSNLLITTSSTLRIDATEFEVVERKGVGHPDTLCDVLAEKISQAYARYCLDHYGVVLRHMVDKIALSGGATHVKFGGGDFITPIRLYLNCRFTRTYQGERIPYMDVVTDVVHQHLKKVLPKLDVTKWLQIVDNTHSAPGPGVVYDDGGESKNERKFFFEVPEESYAEYHDNGLRSNDTSTAVAYYPLSRTEQLVMLIENTLNSPMFKDEHPYVGTDIKVMARRMGNNVDVTLCVPFISAHTPDEQFYQEKLKALETHLLKLLSQEFSEYTARLWINTRDNPESSDYYLTLIGSAIESGDEGVVGRGNRYNGVIPFTRRMSMEACCGKNPVYHVGKLYTAVAMLIAQDIFNRLHLETHVYLTSQMGRDLSNPWSVCVEVCADSLTDTQRSTTQDIVEQQLSHIPDTTLRIVSGDINLY